MIHQLFAPQRTSAESATSELISREIETLEQQAWVQSWNSKGTLYKRLGDLCLTTGEQKRALSYYDRGIDAFLITGQYEAARKLCQKVICSVPEVVRARCTLAFLTMSAGATEEFDHLLAGYVQAAQRAGQERTAISRLRMLADVTDAHQVRLLIAHHLQLLGATRSAGELFNTVFAEEQGRRTPCEDQRARWARVLRLALIGSTRGDERAA